MAAAVVTAASTFSLVTDKTEEQPIEGPGYHVRSMEFGLDLKQDNSQSSIDERVNLADMHTGISLDYYPAQKRRSFLDWNPDDKKTNQTDQKETRPGLFLENIINRK